MDNKLKTVALKEFTYNAELYKIIDFINKNIAHTNIVMGLSEKNGKSIITIYEEE